MWNEEGGGLECDLLLQGAEKEGKGRVGRAWALPWVICPSGGIRADIFIKLWACGACVSATQGALYIFFMDVFML